VSLRAALIAVLALAPAAPAAAAEVSITVAPAAGVRLGSPTEVSGRVTDAGAPLAGRIVVLEVRRHPFDRAWGREAVTGTDDDGSFEFSPELDRNHRVRARLIGVSAEPDVLSAQRDAFVVPAFTLAFEQRGERELRLRQTYTVSRDVKLSAPTRFYVGPCRRGTAGECTGTRARLRATAQTRRGRAGRYRAGATVLLPRSCRGRFRYVSCFVYSPGSGMGDPDQRCPRRLARLR